MGKWGNGKIENGKIENGKIENGKIEKWGNGNLTAFERHVSVGPGGESG